MQESVIHKHEGQHGFSDRRAFSLTAATKFGLLFAVVLGIVRITERYAPAEGLYIVAAVAGLTDVDAITLSMTGYARQGNELGIAAAAIAIAALSNTLVKCGMVLMLGSQPLRLRLAGATAVIVVVGLVAIWLA